MYYLDTNICIHFLNGTRITILERLAALDQREVMIPSVVTAELFYGAEKSVKRSRNLKLLETFLSIYAVASFDASASFHYGHLRATLEHAGQTIGGNDLLIAATALANKAVLVTNNVREFSRIEGLSIEDWTL